MELFNPSNSPSTIYEKEEYPATGKTSTTWTDFFTSPWKLVGTENSDNLCDKVKKVAITVFMIIVTFGLGLIPLAISALIRSFKPKVPSNNQANKLVEKEDQKDLSSKKKAFNPKLLIAQAKVKVREMSFCALKAQALYKIAKFEATFDIPSAKVTLQQAEEAAKFIIQPYEKAVVLIEIAKIQEKIGDENGEKSIIKKAKDALIEAKKAADKMIDSYTKNNALTDIGVLQAQIGAIEEAKKTADKIRDPYEKALVLIEIATTQGKSDKNEEKATLIKVKELLANTDKEIGTLILKQMTLCKIAKILAKIGDVEGAKAILIVAKKPFIEDIGDDQNVSARIGKDNALIDIARLQTQIEDIKEAKKTVEAITNPSYKAEALIEIAIAQKNIGEVEEAKVTLIKAETNAEKINIYNSLSVKPLYQFAIAQAEFGNKEKAKATLIKARKLVNKDEGIGEKILCDITIALAKIGYVEEAKNTAMLLKEGSPKRLIALLNIELNQTASDINGEKDTLYELITKIEPVFKNSWVGDTFLFSLVEVLCELAKAQGENGDREIQKAILKIVIFSACKIENLKDKVKLLQSIAIIQAKNGDIKGAEETVAKTIVLVNGFTHPIHIVETLIDIAKTTAEINKIQ